MTRVVDVACQRAAERFGTPCFVAFRDVFADAAMILGRPGRADVSVSLAYPIKTLPLLAYLRRWKELGRYLEASSSGELELALLAGFPPNRIIVSGPGKASWLASSQIENLVVIFDSVGEAHSLAALAVRLSWRVGLRFAPSVQRDPDEPTRRDQFGMTGAQLRQAVRAVRGSGGTVDLLHFHLGGWTGKLPPRIAAVQELATVADELSLQPRAINIGGGFSQALSMKGAPAAARAASKSVDRLAVEVLKLFPVTLEVIAECGRALVGSSVALVVTVLDTKRKGGERFVICDGGRVNQALPSDWERHAVRFPAFKPNARSSLTTVCGPTCMAWDWIARCNVPIGVKPGDLAIYEAAGAYHIPWESQFSYPTSAIVEVAFGNGISSVIRLLRPRATMTAWAKTWGLP